ncbi:hypothetical protein CRU87_07955 [Aliarcobacter trophiarum LMG 25534]|uniref:Membrane protein n=1 Tax=Aliarcobacter trophiarum LMG 25534 TaxID=1032241 RepID=A0AAD0QIN6_9BACT|nr:hypothetical protein [Aliarcobacter trophiarum]AXK48464.1 putative membrane protein [Aliarcobacter trophiarum LMG 25534]RXJ90005.1 hypothetical protein CRU87_07955 [Aliarcobacter trophiarum LMG 25534]
MRVLKYLLLFFVQLVITFICVFFSIIFIENYVGIATTINPMDSVSLANTFMVFVTFILVGVTLVITLASIWFAKTVSEKKIDIIRDNIKEIVESLLTNKNLQDGVFKEIIEQANVKKTLGKHIEELTKAQRDDFTNEIENTTKKLNDEIENIQKSVISIIDKKIQDLPKANELNELIGGKK